MTLDYHISDLYDQGIVSGNTFLYCVDHDINTVEDLLAISNANIPDDVASDVVYLREELNIPIQTTTIENIDEAAQESISKEASIGYTELYALYQKLKFECDNRTINSLNYIESEYNNNEELIKFILNTRDSDLLKIPRIGRKTALQIIDLSQKLAKYLSGDFECVVKQEDEKVPNTITLPLKNKETINALLEVIRSYADKYSVRVRNCILQLIENCNNNVYQLYEVLSSANFDPKQMRNVGKNSVPGILDFKNRVIALCTELSTDDATIKLERMNKIQRYTQSGISDPESIFSIEAEIGHFPLLYAVNQLIHGISTREVRIIKEYLLVYRGSVERDLDDMAKELSLTRERVRQLANKQIKTLESIISTWKEFLAGYHYPIFEKDSWLLMCEKEGVEYTQNFVKWIISLVDDDVHLLGDPIAAFKTYHGRIRPLYLIPKNLYDVFDIEGYIDMLKQMCEQKRYEDERVNLRNSLCQFFRNDILFEAMDDIDNIVRRIINSELTCYVSDVDIIFSANAEKPICDVIEDIIRTKGQVMRLDEIYNEYIKLYPYKAIECESIRPHIHRNKNIRPIGRSGKYTLAEWKEGYARGGTIREFAYECILGSPCHIVSLTDLCKYIAQFREDVEEDSIQTNLLADASGRYGLYIKDGVRYIGLSAEQHDHSYALLSNEEARRSTEQSYTLLEKFIVENKRFPFSSGPGDEPRLYRFWNVQSAYNKHGDLEGPEKLIYDRISIVYADYQVSRSDFLWYKSYVEFKQRATCISFLVAGKAINKWFYNNTQLYQADQLQEWQMPLFKELLEIVNRIVKSNA